jgi:NAD(P)-dependent dehydrogenase (short-subunit alcohol dehydrogenase family)
MDTLINNAGLQHVAKLEEFPVEKWDLLIDVMLKGTFLMTRAVLPGMGSRGFGRIINIGSIHSLVASAFKSGYVAAKHALVGFAKAVALMTNGSRRPWKSPRNDISCRANRVVIVSLRRGNHGCGQCRFLLTKCRFAKRDSYSP